MSLAKKKKEELPIKMYNKSHLFKNVFQYQMAKFNNVKPSTTFAPT